MLGQYLPLAVLLILAAAAVGLRARARCGDRSAARLIFFVALVCGSVWLPAAAASRVVPTTCDGDDVAACVAGAAGGEVVVDEDRVQAVGDAHAVCGARRGETCAVELARERHGWPSHPTRPSRRQIRVRRDRLRDDT